MMPIDAITALGLVAATCTTVAFVPQILKNWKTRSAGDLSFGTFGLFTIGLTLWLTYGLVTRDLPIIAANIVTLALNIANLVQMVKYRNRPQGPPSAP